MIKYVKRKGYLDREQCCKCQTEAVSKRRDKIKIMALEYKGGKCEVCGYCKCVRALEFHHIKKKKKDFGISYKGESRSWKRIR